MKLNLPKIKSKKGHSEANDGFSGFDLTGNSAAVKKTDDTFGLITDNSESFEVSVRNAEPILKRLDTEKKVGTWVRDLQINLATAVILLAMFGLILESSYQPDLIIFALPVIPVFMLLTTLESLDKMKIKLFTAAAIAAALIAVLIIFRNYIGSGWALIMNQFYDSAEEAQAYIYDRFGTGSMAEAHPYRSMHFALLWGSSLIGLITALPPARARRLLAAVLGMLTMIAYAYYGLIPSGVCIAVIAAALVFAVTRGHILASLPVLLIVMLVFGAIMFIDPGENYGISRADENFRDRFALRSSYLDSGDMNLNDLEQMEQEMQDQQNEQNETESGLLTEHRWMLGLFIVLAILAAAGAAAWVFMQRVRKKQLANRAGIDSSDPREAVVAMFPYAVRWLQPAGIETSGKTFDSLIPVIRADVSREYADNYENMYELWKEAAYSDHDIGEESRNDMHSFLQDTMDMIRGKGNFRTNLINSIKYAL